jgi:WD40 repeat protein
VVVVAGERGNQLWMRSLDQLNGQVIRGTEGAGSPFWSPDSRHIGFFTAGKLKRVDLSGAPPLTICDVPSTGRGGTWNNDGVILFGTVQTGIRQVAATGGPVRPVTELDKTRFETGHSQPWFLPDGQHFLFLAQSSNPEDNAIFVASVAQTGRKFLVKSQVRAVFAPPNQLFYLRADTVLAHQFDVDRLELVGDPVTVAESVIVNPSTGANTFSVGAAGQLAYRAGSNVTLGRELGFVDSGGKQLGASLAGQANYQNPVLSLDGQRVAVNRADQGSDIWILDLVRGGSTKFTFDSAVDNHPLWSPDGQRLVFSSARGGQIANLYEKPSAGAGQDRVLLTSEHTKTPTDWSRDGRFILYEDLDPKTGADLMVLPMTGDRKPTAFLRTPFNERKARFSPDGKWVAYTSDESGLREVYVQSFPPNGGKWLISTAGGNQPTWRANGKELFYISPEADDQFMAVDILSAPGDTDFKIGVPKKLFITNVLTGGDLQRNSYDLTKDGRLLLNGGYGGGGAPARSMVTIVLNWDADLKK